jgi:hypothetical protein
MGWSTRRGSLHTLIEYLVPPFVNFFPRCPLLLTSPHLTSSQLLFYLYILFYFHTTHACTRTRAGTPRTMSRLHLEYTLSLEEMKTTIETAMCSCDCEEIFLDSLDIDLCQAALITRLVSQSGRHWKQIDLEGCSGVAFATVLTIIFTSSVSNIKLSCAWDEPLSEESFKGIALGITSNTRLEKLTLSTSLDCTNMRWLSDGLMGSAGLRSFLLWDCRLEQDRDVAATLASGLVQGRTLEEFGMVACVLGQDQLGAILDAVATNNHLKYLDLRGCAGSNLPLVASLLERDSTLRSLDVSFQNDNGESMNVELLREALQNHPTLEQLHVCRNHITDEGLDTLLDAVTTSSSLRLLNLSLNSITCVANLARRLADNTLPLQCLLLDGNPIEDPTPLLSALKSSNTTLETCLIPQHFETDQKMINHYTRLNRGGRRVVMGKERISRALWPVLFDRANRLNFDNCSNALGRAEVIYYLLQGSMFASE